MLNEFKLIGRFLSIYNCNSGNPMSVPSDNCYIFLKHDYFRVGTSGNKIPVGKSYNNLHTKDVEERIKIGDTLIFDGNNWNVQSVSAGSCNDLVQHTPKLISHKCTSCGASLKMKPYSRSIECEYCHSIFILY